MKWAFFTLPLFCVAAANAQDALSLSSSDLVQVKIVGELNARSGPSTEAPRVTRFASGEILRRISCEDMVAEDWCEVETLDGSLEVWASAAFLVPWYGADPAVMTTLSIPSDRELSLADGQQLTGTLQPGEVVDVRINLAAEVDAQIALQGPEGIALAVLDASGDPIDQARDARVLDVMIMTPGVVIARIVDLEGLGGTWVLDVKRN